MELEEKSDVISLLRTYSDCTHDKAGETIYMVEIEDEN